MAAHTTNLNLIKPEMRDLFDIEVMNQNMDSIDKAVNTLADEQAQKLESLETTVGEIVETLAQITSKLDTIQSRVNSIPTSKTTCSYSASTVNSIKTTVESILSKMDSSGSSSSGDVTANTYKLLYYFINSIYNMSQNGSNSYFTLAFSGHKSGNVFLSAYRFPAP